LLSDQHRERSADRTTDYACPFAAQIESRHLGVIAGPAAERLAATIGAAARLIAVRMLSAQGLKVAAKAVGWQRPRMRIRWRRWLARSWHLSRWHYRRHGLVLAGRPTDHVWYFAYGSNMHEGTLVERRRIRPLESRAGRVTGYRLRFNLEGRPKGRAAPANICPDADQEVWGVLHKITRRDLLRLDSTEGVPGRGYRPTLLVAEDLDGHSIPAIAYVASGKEIDGNPSLRYISLLRAGARHHGLPEHWLQFLDGVSHSE
jgi:cation transport regulator ChaC